MRPSKEGDGAWRRLISAALLIGVAGFAVPAHAQIAFRAAASAGNPETISFVGAGAMVVSTTSGGSLTPALPGSTQVDDVALAFVVGRPTDTSEPAAPAGWTKRTPTSLREAGANDLKLIVFYKVLLGGDTNPSFTVPANWSGAAAGMAAAIGVWRGVDVTTPFDVADVASNAAAAATWTPTAITTATANAWVVSVVASADDNALGIGTANGFGARMSGASYNTTTGGDLALGVSDKAQAAAGAVTMNSWTQTANGNDAWAGITLALRPSTGALSIDKPTGTVANDIMVASIAVRPNTITATAPSGWNLVRRIDNSNPNANSLAVYYKVAGASEPGSYTWTLSAGHTGAAGGIQTFSGVDPTTPIDVENGQNTPNGTAHATPSVTPTVFNTMLVTAHTVANADTWTPPTGMTEGFDKFGGTEAVEGNYVAQAAITATGAKQATSATADVGNAHILALRPLNACTAITDTSYVSATAVSGTTSVTLNWSSPNAPLVLRKTSAFSTEAPSNGTSYTAGGTIGTATILYDGSTTAANMTCTAGSCVNSSLTNGTTYYYKVFPRSGNCYATGTGAEISVTPKAGTSPAWSYTLAGGALLKPGIAGDGTVHTASNASRIISLSTTDGTQTWAPMATNDVIQGWVSWLPAPVTAGWYNASWTARKRIRIDQTKVGAGGVANFPVLISLTDTGLKSKAQASGNDILFTSADGTTKLSHEVERYTSSTGELIAWVKVPSLSSSADTDLFMYYGNAGATNQQDAVNVWDTAFKGVWHLKEDPGPGAAGDIKDSTSNAKHGTASAAMTSANLVAGKVGSGLSFISGGSGSGTLVDLGDQAVYQLAVYSWSMWVKGTVDPACNAGGTNGQPLWNADSQFNFAWQHTGCTFNKAAAHTDGTWRSAQIQSPMSAGVWYHVAGTYDGTNLRVYLNGILEATTAHGAPITAAGSLSLGNGVGATNFAGQLDEVRVSNTARSAAWLRTEYNNQSSPSTFYSVGAENASSVVLGGDQSGHLYAVDVATWATLWALDLSANADFIQASPAAQLRAYSNAAFQAAYTDDVIFVASRNSGSANCGTSTTNNKVFALRATDGAVLWTFNSTCSVQMDWIEGMPYVDYARNRLYVTTRAGAGGTQTSLWVIDTLTGAQITPPSPLGLGQLRAAPSLSADGATIYAGSWNGTTGTLYAVNATTLAVKWNLVLGAAGNIKGFIWEDFNTPGRLYFSNGNEIRCVQDFGASGSACAGWTLAAVAGAGTPLLLDKVYVGSSDGKVHQINLSTGVDEKQFPAATTLDGTQVGDVSTETANELFVGTLAGKLYKIPLPLP